MMNNIVIRFAKSLIVVTTDLISYTAYLPYYDETTSSIIYAGVPSQGVLHDAGSGLDQVGILNALFGSLNNTNKNWSALINPTTIHHDLGVTGEFDINLFAFYNLIVSIYQVPDSLNYWYNTTDFAKYGIINFTASGVPAQSVSFLNWKTQTFQNHDAALDGVRVLLMPGVGADLTSAARSIIPPYYFDAGGGPLSWNQNLSNIFSYGN